LRRLGLGCRRERAELLAWESGQDHVAILAYNCPEWIELMYGVWKARAAFLNVNYRYKAEEMVHLLGTGEARAIVYHAAFAPLVAEVRRDLPPLRHLIQLRDDSGLGGRSLVAPPFMHGAGQWVAFNTFHRGGTAILPDETRRLDAHALWRAVERHRVDQMTIVGDAFARPMLEALREGRYDVSSVRVIGSTAAVFSASIKRELAALLPEAMFIESVGATEAGLQAMSWDA